MNDQQKKQVAGAVLGIIFFIAIMGHFYGGGAQKSIEQQICADLISQYNIVKRSGSQLDICMHAGAVSASYLQAKDEANFVAWRQIEKHDCELAGMP